MEDDSESNCCPVDGCTRSFASRMSVGVHLGHSHTDDEVRELILDDVRTLTSELDGFPTASVFCENTRWNTATIYNHFDSWNTIRDSLGYNSTPPRSTKQISRNDLIEEIKRLHRVLGRVPTSIDMKESGRYSTGTYHYRFDSWENAVREAGFKPVWEMKGACAESIYYGANFPEQRKRTLERDDYQCQACSMLDDEHTARFGHSLHCHHIKKARSFIPDDGTPDYEAMNDLSNLITLCASCHRKYEGRWTSAKPHEFAQRATVALEQEPPGPIDSPTHSD